MLPERRSCGASPPCQECRKLSCNGWGWGLIFTGSLKFRIWRVDRANGELIFDVARRFAQPLGVHLDQWEGRIIETKKGIVRLLGVTERARQLFGEDGAQA